MLHFVITTMRTFLCVPHREGVNTEPPEPKMSPCNHKKPTTTKITQQQQQQHKTNSNHHFR